MLDNLAFLVNPALLFRAKKAIKEYLVYPALMDRLDRRVKQV